MDFMAATTATRIGVGAGVVITAIEDMQATGTAVAMATAGAMDIAADTPEVTAHAAVDLAAVAADVVNK